MIMDVIKHMLGIQRTASDKREQISALSNNIVHEARELNTALKAYAEHENPFMALAIDLQNKRAAKQQLAQWNGQ